MMTARFTDAYSNPERIKIYRIRHQFCFKIQLEVYANAGTAFSPNGGSVTSGNPLPGFPK
jgi:hypothetical protein